MTDDIGLMCLEVADSFFDRSPPASVATPRISDALPLPEAAKKVRIVTVTNEKVSDAKHSAEELAKNLSRRGIDVVLDKVDAKGSRLAKYSKHTSFRMASTCL